MKLKLAMIVTLAAGLLTREIQRLILRIPMTYNGPQKLGMTRLTYPSSQQPPYEEQSVGI